MKLRARHRGIDQLHDDFFNRVKGRTVSATHHDDETTELHYHVLTFSKLGEPDADLPVVPVTALVRPHFSLSRERVMHLQALLMEKANELLKVFDSFELAQLHYCIGSVWSVAWLPLEEGARLATGRSKPLLDVDAKIDSMNDQAFNELPGRQVFGIDADTHAPSGIRYYALELGRLGEKPGEISVVPMTTALRLHEALEYATAQLQREVESNALLRADLTAASGSQSEGAALSGRAEHAVPPEASPEGRTASTEDFRFSGRLTTPTLIARVAASEMPKEREPTATADKVLHPLHSIDVEIDNLTEFAITADATFLGTLADKGARYELARCVLTIRNVEPQPGAIWPE